MNEDQYYNPIIQAMIHTAQLQKQGQQQEIEKQKNKEEAAVRQEQLKQTQQQIEQAHENQLEQHRLTGRHLDIQEQQAGLQAEMHKFQSMKIAQELMQNADPEARKKIAAMIPTSIRNAISPQNQIQFQQPGQQPTPGPVVAPDEQTNPLAGLYSDDVANAHIYNQSAAKSGGTAAGEEPFKARDEERKFKSASDLLGVHSKYDLIHLEKQQQGLKELADINGRWHLLGSAALRRAGDLADADTVKQVVDGLYNATVDWTKLPKELKDSVVKYAGAIGEASTLPTDYKKQSARITALSNIEPIMQHLEDLAQNFSRDSPGAFAKGNQEFGIPLVGGTVGRVAEGSDLASRQGTLSGFLGQFAAFFDNWPGRKSNQEIERMKQGAFDPKATMAQNKKKIEEHAKLMKSAVQDMIVGMKPERAKQLLLEHNLDPDKYLGQGSDSGEIKEGQTATGPNGHKIIYRGGKWEEK